MAIYHCSVKTISRNAGRSSVGASAYRAGEKMTNEYDGMTHDYSRKSGVEYSGVILPENAPEIYQDRETLWNAVERSEVRINSRTAREIEIALPVELDRQEQIQLVQEYARTNFVDRGMCADIALHDKGDGNPHAHIMLTTREIGPEGFTTKNRDWDKRENVEQWRESWADICNREFERKGIEERIDHRTLQAQGIEREPTIHLGPHVAQMEKRGIQTERGMYNKEVRERNMEYNRKFDELKQMVEESKTEQKPELEVYAEPDESAEQVADRMHGLKEQYLSIANRIKEAAEKTAKQNKAVDDLAGRYSLLKEYANDINNAQSRASQLQQRRNSLGIFEGREKKELDAQIDIINRSRDQAIDNLKRDCGIEPNQAETELQKLAQQGCEIQRRIDKNMHGMDVLRMEQERIEIEYKKEKILAQFRPDKEEINFLLKSKDKKPLSMAEQLQLNKLEATPTKKDHVKINAMNLTGKAMNIAKLYMDFHGQVMSKQADRPSR